MIEQPLEKELWQTYDSIVGIDEAGRGPIAGPLVVAGCVFEKGYWHPDIDDSKSLHKKRRNRVLKLLKEVAYWFRMT